jgi:hypothetical protein
MSSFYVRFGSVLSALLALGFLTACPDTPSKVSRGSVSLTWSIIGQEGRVTSCEAARTPSVSVRLHNPSTAEDLIYSFACFGGSGVTPLLPTGNYDAEYQLLLGDGTPLATVREQTRLTVGDGKVTAPAPVTFLVDPRGGLALSLATPPFTSNCKTGNGGAGITANTITLERIEGGCAAVTFVRTRGAQQLGTYTVDCGSPQASTCIEDDETLSVPDLASGEYVLRVRGLLGFARCFSTDTAIRVPAGAQRLVRTIEVPHQEISGCLSQG